MPIKNMATIQHQLYQLNRYCITKIVMATCKVGVVTACPINLNNRCYHQINLFTEIMVMSKDLLAFFDE